MNNGADKETFPSFEEELQNWRESTTFLMDFMIAERFGTSAVKDTFNRAFKAWKKSAKYITELCIVTNHLCWLHHDKGNIALSRYYADCYHKCCGEMFKADDEGKNTSAFTDEEVTMMYRVID